MLTQNKIKNDLLSNKSVNSSRLSMIIQFLSREVAINKVNYNKLEGSHGL